MDKADGHGLSGRSIREIQRLIGVGTSLADLDCVAVGYYGCEPASSYVNGDGTTTERGGAKKRKTTAKKLAVDACNAAIGLMMATIGFHNQPLDLMHDRRYRRRGVSDRFEGWRRDMVEEWARGYREQMAKGRRPM